MQDRFLLNALQSSFRRAGGVFDRDGGKMLIVAMIFGVVDRDAARSLPTVDLAFRTCIQFPVHRRDGRRWFVGFRVQLGQCRRQILGMNVLVGRVFVLALPSVRWTGRWRDEEELLALGGAQMLVDRLDRSGASKEDTDTFSHDVLAVKHLTYPNSGVDVEEGHDDASEGLQRSP